MKPYSEHRPTQFDSHITVSDIETWLVLPCSRNRDSECLQESNFHTALKMLGGESDDVQVHRFGHWGPGWYELILVRPDSAAHKTAIEIESSIEVYPVLDENDFSDRETEAANQTWKHCYSEKQRLEYIRDHRSQFEFRSFTDMLGCVRGNYFAGYASELL